MNIRPKLLIASAALVALATTAGAASAASGTLSLLRPWSGANLAAPETVVVGYSIDAGKRVPPGAVTAVNKAVATWNLAIDSREAGWKFDLIPATGRNADIKIRLKNGGSPFVAGTARPRLDKQGFTSQVSISVTGRFSGTPASLDAIEETALHELGHALGLGHHSNETDLMGETLGSAAEPSACDLDGFETVHAWLADSNPATGPALPNVTSINCE